MGTDTTAVKKKTKEKDERNPMNMTTTVGKQIFVGTYRLFTHLISMKTTVGKHLLGNGERW